MKVRALIERYQETVALYKIKFYTAESQKNQKTLNLQSKL